MLEPRSGGSFVAGDAGERAHVEAGLAILLARGLGIGISRLGGQLLD